MRSIELTLNDVSDAAIRSDWTALTNAGLPSLASHTGASNAPHVTLAAGEDLADSALVRSAFDMLPLELEFGGVILFRLHSSEGFVLARSVVATEALLALHRAVHAASSGALELTLPGRWTPHVTLARRISLEQLAPALEVLDDAVAAWGVAARLWDGRGKTITPLRERPQSANQ